jgi:uncharacterized protein (TIGR03032 family)
LNGLALADGQPEFVTALGSSDIPEGWRRDKVGGGVLMHVPTGEILLNDLPIPHSPRIHNDQLYMLFSATGEVVRVDPDSGAYYIIQRLPGFTRGMAGYGDYLFVGLSQVRDERSSFIDIPIADESIFCGIMAVRLPDGAIVGEIRFGPEFDEIFDVQVMPNPDQSEKVMA